MKIKQFLGATLLMAFPLAFTSCDEDIWGEWSKPTPTVITPEEEEEDYDAVSNALTFEPVSSNVTVTIKNGSATNLTIKYTKNGGSKTSKTITAGGGTQDIEIAAGDILQLYGDGTTNKTYADMSGFTNITFSAECYVYGNIMSLVDEEGFAENKTLTGDYAFMGLFMDMAWNEKLKSHPTKNLVLPATTLTKHCYDQMFYGCTNLTKAPELPAEELAKSCYEVMFSDCTNLTKAPKLPATTLVKKCYYCMFINCTSLTEAWVKAGYTKDDDKCTGMFYHCADITTNVLHTASGNKDSWNGTSSGQAKYEVHLPTSWTVTDDY